MEQTLVQITNIIPYIFPFFLTLILSVSLTFVVLKVATKLNWLAFPRSDRWHSKPVALMGGVAIFISASVSYIVLTDWDLASIWLGGTIMFVAGFWDDRFEMKPIFKFISQLLAASLLVSSGYIFGGPDWPFWISYPLTFLWIIGLTNAINLLDNMDGLAAGVTIIIGILIGLFGLKFSSTAIAMSSFILAGAAAGFLFFNFKPAKVFMGDCGSLFLGYSLAGLSLAFNSILGISNSDSLIVILVAIMVLPIFDTTLVTLARIFKGRSPSQGGKDHSSHRLVILGLSEKQSVLTLYTITAFPGLISLFLYPGKLQLFYVVAASGMIALFFLARYLFQVDVYDQKHQSAIEKGVANIPDVLKSRLQVASIIIDVTLIIISLVLAHYIRFEGWNIEVRAAVMEILLGAIVIKVLLIAFFGLYQSVWKHAGVADLLRLAAASFLGSIAVGSYAWFYTGPHISVSVFVIDAFLFFFILAASRFAFKGLRRIFAIPQQAGRNVLLYGAGDAGWLALSEIRQNKDINLNPVGFIDDSPYKKNGQVQGISVLGSRKEMYQIILKYDIKEVLICVRNLSKQNKKEIITICEASSIRCRRFVPSFTEMESDSSGLRKLPRHDFSYQN